MFLRFLLGFGVRVYSRAFWNKWISEPHLYGVFSVEYINIRIRSIFFALRINELAVLLFFARETRQLELSFADYNVLFQ